MEGNKALARRALIATALTIGFYSMAIIIGVGAIALPLAAAFVTKRPVLHFIVLGFIGGGTILMAILPRKDRFDPPGPLLLQEKQPRLFATIQDIAEKTGQPMPKFVYLIHDFNAWVAQRGGSGIYGGARMMGIGLPLLQQMSVAQFRAVMAHEFGHYHNGDTTFGARIYRTRSAIARTVQELEDRQSLLRAPFKWYGRKFIQITQAISRHQEFHADQLAAELAGRKTMTETLHVIARMGSAYEGYLQHEYLPAVKYHMLPPLLDGFDRYVRADFVRKQIDQIAEEELAQEASGTYDTHPALAERLAALNQLPDNTVETDSTPAIDLLDSRDELERNLLRELVGESKYAGMKPIRWETDLAAVDCRRWKDVILPNRRYFREFTPAEIPDFVNDPTDYLRRALGMQKYPREVIFGWLNELGAAIQAAFAAMLVRHGFVIRRSVGEEPVLVRGEREIRPFSLLQDLSSEELSVEAWRQLCDQLGITDELLFIQDPIPV